MSFWSPDVTGRRISVWGADDFRNLNKAPDQRILRKLKWLSENYDNLTPEPLAAEFKGLFKLRAGSYRALYNDTDKKIITIHIIGHRKNIYKKK